jgi:2-polyprenyl-6-methoxyphenol hydroxylase-like FAD-dependent oxidoreductase
MLIQNKEIAIIGGGPGGLTLARLLQQKGAQVKVYERDINKDVRVQGATLDLHEESGLAALEKAGLMDAFRASYRPGADKIRVMDQQGVIHFDEHTGGNDLMHGRPEIDRGPLRKLLLESLQPETVVWNSQFEAMEKQDGRWIIQFRNGTTATADLVIGVDGANSKVRPYLTDIKPYYSGITMIEGTIPDAVNNSPKIFELLKGGKIFAFGNSKTLIVSSKANGDMSFYTGGKMDESWVKDCGIDFADCKQLLAWFKTEYPEWDSLWWELFSSDKTYFIPRPQYCMSREQSWTTLSDLTLLGDAAHVMLPFAGEGVNMAMLDALELSECLTSTAFETLHDAISAYERQMGSRIHEIAGITMQQTESMHSEDGLKDMLDLFSGEQG